ncbi:DUF2645 family protein [Orbaceae bacterium ac157xtp]
MKYIFTSFYSIFASFIMLMLSTNEYEYWLVDFPDEFTNLCMLPTGNDNSPQSWATVMLIFFIPLLIPFFLAKKKEKIVIIVIALSLLAFWYYRFFIRFDC